MSEQLAPVEAFSEEEAHTLAPYFTNVDRPVFALTNLPETVKGALFARYSRSAKSLRRLFLDEFAGDAASRSATASSSEGADAAAERSSRSANASAERSSDSAKALADRTPEDQASERADRLYAKVFSDFGDDSVAQLGAAHLACEGVSNVLTKVLEWGRLMSYLEQSTRYVPYTDRPGGRWKYHVPSELDGSPLRGEFVETLDLAFATYAKWLPAMEAHFRAKYPKAPQDSDAVHRGAIRAKALDTLRGLLPAATRSNVGLFGTGQAYEALVMRMLAHPVAEVQAHARLILEELRKVMPAFLARIDQPDRGGRWIDYLARTRAAFEADVQPVVAAAAEPRPEVTLTEFDPDGETKIVAAALYSASDLPDDQLLAIARRLPADERARILRAYVGSRTNRRHKPGRAFERTHYRFDVLTDYGAFRDLQRHRLLTLEWQPLGTRHGYTEPAAIEEAGALAEWRTVMDQSAHLFESLESAGLRAIAPYAVLMAYRVRFYMDMSAREAMHVIELRTAPQGHPAYRRVCQQMHRLIDEVAGHHALAEAMRFVDHSGIELERLQSERALERKRTEAKR